MEKHRAVNGGNYLVFDDTLRDAAAQALLDAALAQVL